MSITSIIRDNINKELPEYFKHYDNMPKTGINIIVTLETYDPISQKNGDFITITLTYKKKYTYLKRYNIEEILFKGHYICLHEIFDEFYVFLIKKAMWEFTRNNSEKDENTNEDTNGEGGEN